MLDTKLAEKDVTNERLPYLDFIRGIAVLGLIIMNAPFMGVTEYGYLPFVPDVTSDSVVRVSNAFLFDGRFRNLFCLLFGIGLYLQSHSYSNKGLNAYLMLKSRLKWLLLFGFIHCIVIWPGDILIFYALCGFILLKNLDDTSEKLIKKGIKWVLLGFIINSAFTAIVSLELPTSRADVDYADAISLSTASYFSGWQDNLIIAIAYVVSFPIVTMFSLCGVMFLGIGLFKSGELKEGFKPIALVALFAITLIVSALDAILAVRYLHFWFLIENILGYISGLTMALLIWHVVLRTKVYMVNGVFVQAIKSVGTLAFSLYIFQSLSVTILLRVVFPEWLEWFSLIDFWLLSVMVIFSQLVIGFLYKRHFKQGPLEFIWRKLITDRLA